MQFCHPKKTLDIREGNEAVSFPPKNKAASTAGDRRFISDAQNRVEPHAKLTDRIGVGIALGDFREPPKIVLGKIAPIVSNAYSSDKMLRLILTQVDVKMNFNVRGTRVRFVVCKQTNDE